MKAADRGSVFLSNANNTFQVVWLSQFFELRLPNGTWAEYCRERKSVRMDFLTGMAYWGIILLVIVNALLVSRMNIEIDQDEE